MGKKKKSRYWDPRNLYTWKPKEKPKEKSKEENKEEKKEEEKSKEKKKKKKDDFSDEILGLTVKIHLRNEITLIGKVLDARKYELKLDLGDNEIIYVLKHAINYIKPIGQTST